MEMIYMGIICCGILVLAVTDFFYMLFRIRKFEWEAKTIETKMEKSELCCRGCHKKIKMFLKSQRRENGDDNAADIALVRSHKARKNNDSEVILTASTALKDMLNIIQKSPNPTGCVEQLAVQVTQALGVDITKDLNSILQALEEKKSSNEKAALLSAFNNLDKRE